MFPALIIPAFLSPCVVPTAECEIIKIQSRLNLPNFENGSLAFQDVLSPFESVGPLAKLHFLQSDDLTRKYQNGTKKSVHNKRDVPVVRVPRVPSKDYGQSSHYRIKGSRDEDWDSTKKSFYMSILQKLLRPRYSRLSRKGKDYYDTGKFSGPTHISTAPMEASPGGWGWSGWSSKGHGGHGISLLDAILCGLSFLSLGGFLLNLLLNLLNMFGFGMTTSTSTYPVTVTQTQTATSTGGTGGTTGGTITYPTAPITALAGTGWGITGRTIDSMAGNGWGSGGTKAVLKGHVKFGGSKGGWGWPSTTTTTTEPPPTEPTLPTLTGTGGTGDPIFSSGRKKRRKREIFQPYVNPSTALNTFAKAILNSIDAATNKYECIEKIYCENNKQARVIGQWLEYFMPVYSFSLSYFGHRVGAHERLVDHIGAIVLGVTETNCQAHFPRCGEQ